ncbi:MAG: hypothetical protein OXF02_05715 [Simkaniaceae bacterium]|nr:hypothetical protein [Simkaniaceae bacterium]
MSITLDATITSQPVSKESDVDAPVRFPKKETEVARKADKVGCYEVFQRLSMVDKVNLTLVNSSGVIGIPCTITAVVLGGVFGGPVVAVGAGFSTLLPFFGLAVGGCVFTFRENIKDCRCCRSELPKVKAIPELEEVVIEQPKSKPPSPEPEPAKEGWWNLSSWFASPSETDESVDESPV